MTPADFKRARQSLSLNQAEAARVLGYGSDARISAIETGRRNPSASVLKLLRAYLDGYRPHDWPKQENDRRIIEEAAEGEEK